MNRMEVLERQIVKLGFNADPLGYYNRQKFEIPKYEIDSFKFNRKQISSLFTNCTQCIDLIDNIYDNYDDILNNYIEINIFKARLYSEIDDCVGIDIYNSNILKIQLPYRTILDLKKNMTLRDRFLGMSNKRHLQIISLALKDVLLKLNNTIDWLEEECLYFS